MLYQKPCQYTTMRRNCFRIKAPVLAQKRAHRQAPGPELAPQPGHVVAMFVMDCLSGGVGKRDSCPDHPVEDVQIASAWKRGPCIKSFIKAPQSPQCVRAEDHVGSGSQPSSIGWIIRIVPPLPSIASPVNAFSKSSGGLKAHLSFGFQGQRQHGSCEGACVWLVTKAFGKAV